MQSGEFKNSSCGCLSVLHSWTSFLGLLSFWPNKVIITGKGLQADICWGTSQAILFPCIIKEVPKLHRAPWWPGIQPQEQSCWSSITLGIRKKNRLTGKTSRVAACVCVLTPYHHQVTLVQGPRAEQVLLRRKEGVLRHGRWCLVEHATA